MENKLNAGENELLKELFEDKEKYLINKLKYFKSQLDYSRFATQTDKEFYASQIFYYDDQLILLKSLQLKILK